MLVHIDRIYATPVRAIVAAGRLSWPFHMKVHYCDINNLTLPDKSDELVVFEKQDGADNATFIESCRIGKFNTYLADLSKMGVKYAIVDISAKPSTHMGICTWLMCAADTAVVPTKDRMVWETSL